MMADGPVRGAKCVPFAASEVAIVASVGAV